jgi:hypothetical protein
MLLERRSKLSHFHALERPGEVTHTRKFIPWLRAQDRGQRPDLGPTNLDEKDFEHVGKKKNKTKSPNTKAKKENTKLKNNKKRCPCDRHRGLPHCEGARHYLVPTVKSKLLHMVISGAFLDVREAGALTNVKASTLKRAQRRTTLQQGMLMR